MRYLTTANDRCGTFAEREAGSFVAALLDVIELSRQYGSAVVCLANLDRHDYDSDGLTEDERELFEFVREEA